MYVLNVVVKFVLTFVVHVNEVWRTAESLLMYLTKSVQVCGKIVIKFVMEPGVKSVAKHVLKYVQQGLL